MDFKSLVKKLNSKLKGIVYKIGNYHSFFDEDDLYQEALIHLWTDFSCGKLKDKTDSYILQGCYFHLKNYIRKASDKRKVLSMNEILDKEDMPHLEFADFLTDERRSNYFNELNTRLIAEAIRNNGLTGREKRILAYYSRGLNFRQVGRRLGVSHVSIVKAMLYIRKKCRRHIDI